MGWQSCTPSSSLLGECQPILSCASIQASHRFAFSLSTRYRASRTPPCVRAEVQQGKEVASDPVNDASGEALTRPARGFGPQRPAAPASKSPKEPSSKETKPSKAAATSKASKSGTVRRAAPDRPLLLSQVDPEVRKRENAFVVAMTVLGSLILVEGLTLAASGLLPEEWDGVLLKYVYPAFTPTVGLFLAGAVAYGVYKIRQGGGEPE